MLKNNKYTDYDNGDTKSVDLKDIMIILLLN